MEPPALLIRLDEKGAHRGRFFCGGVSPLCERPTAAGLTADVSIALVCVRRYILIEDSEETRMNIQKYARISGIVFAAVAILHLLRSLFETPMIIGNWIVPLWLSWVAFLGAGVLSIWAFRLSRR